MEPAPMMVDPYLHVELRPGEQLLWWGKPDPTHRAKTGTAQMVNIIVYSVLAVAMAGLVIFDISLLNEESTLGLDQNGIFLLFVSLVLLGLYLFRLYMLYRQHTQYTTKLRNTTYGITNQRVIVMTSNAQNFTVHSFGSNDIGPINRIETGGGWGDVSYGKMRQVQQGLRTVTVVEKLVGVPNARMVEDLLVRTFKNAAPPAPQMFYAPQTPPFPQPYPPQPQQYRPRFPQE